MTDEHSHPVLPWYEYDDVAYVEVLKGGKVYERFESYETEDDIKRYFRDMGMYGTFEVRGLDEDYRPLPHKGEITITNGNGHLSNFLGKSKRVKFAGTRDDAPKSADVTDTVLEHLRQRESAEERERREKERHLAGLYERQDAERRAAMEERRAEQERLLEREREIERERAEKAEREAREAAEKARREAEDKVQSIQRMYEVQLAGLKQSSAQETNMLSNAMSAQVAQANTQAEIWRQKCEMLEADNKRLTERLSDVRDEARKDIERARERMIEQAEDRTRVIEERFALKEEHYKHKIENLESRVEEYKDKMREYELQMVQLNMSSQMNERPSAEFQETMALLKAGKEYGMDPSKIIEQRLGIEDAKEEKESAIDKIVSGMLPMVAQKVAGLPPGAQGGTQGADSASKSSAQGSDTFAGATIQRL